MEILALYYFFSFLFILAAGVDDDDNTFMKLYTLILALVLGWLITPIVLGVTIKKLFKEN